jgi:hypothetical protein
LKAQTNGQPFLCEFGLQGGCGYYVGDATPHIFMNPREAYSAHFRYKFTKRWAIQAKFSGQRIIGDKYTMNSERLNEKWSNRLYNVDVMAEFNFLPFGEADKNNRRIKPYTPYIFAGLGAGVYNGVNEGTMTASGYVPLGIGFKWKFHERVGLNIAWQHNIYFADDLEGQSSLSDRHQLNGSNWMNCDVTGMLTAGIVFEFARAKKACKICNW